MLINGFMTFAAYIQYFISSLLIVTLASAAELNQHNLSTLIRIASFILSIFLFCFCLLFIIWTINKWFKARKANILVSMCYSKQLFEGVKLTNLSRFNTSKFLIQRFTLCCIATFWRSNLYFLKISIYCLVQCCSLIFMCIVRPFSNQKDNICEIISDIHYFILCTLLFFLWNEKKWSKAGEIAYLLFTTISVVYMVKTIIKKLSDSKNAQIAVKETKSQLNRENTQDLTREVQETKLNATKLNFGSQTSESPMKMLPNNNERDASSSFRRDITPGSKPSFEINTFKSPNEKQSNNNDQERPTYIRNLMKRNISNHHRKFNVDEDYS